MENDEEYKVFCDLFLSSGYCR